MKRLIIALSAIFIFNACSGKDKSEPPVTNVKKLVTLTYNIHHGAPENSNEVNLNNIAAVIKKSGAEVIALQGELSRKRMQGYVGRTHEVLIEGTSRKNENQWKGRNSQNAVCVFDKLEGQKLGDLVTVFVHGNTQGTLLGETV